MVESLQPADFQEENDVMRRLIDTLKQVLVMSVNRYDLHVMYQLWLPAYEKVTQMLI